MTRQRAVRVGALPLTSPFLSLHCALCCACCSLPAGVLLTVESESRERRLLVSLGCACLRSLSAQSGGGVVGSLLRHLVGRGNTLVLLICIHAAAAAVLELGCLRLGGRHRDVDRWLAGWSLERGEAKGLGW